MRSSFSRTLVLLTVLALGSIHLAQAFAPGGILAQTGDVIYEYDANNTLLNSIE